MNQDRRLEIFREMEERRKLRAKRPIAEKLAVTERLREFTESARPGACGAQSETRKQTCRDQDQDAINSSGLADSINLCSMASSK